MDQFGREGGEHVLGVTEALAEASPFPARNDPVHDATFLGASKATGGRGEGHHPNRMMAAPAEGA